MHNTFDTRPPAEVTERHRTGPDALTFTSTPILKRGWSAAKGTTEPHRHPGAKTDCHESHGYSNVTLGHTHDQELYKVRTKPHLYEGWHVDMVEELRAAYVADCTAVLEAAVEDWNCHHCKTAVLTREGDTCPHCDRR